MPDENEAATTFKASEFRTSSKASNKTVKHQTLIDRLTEISQQTDRVLYRLQREEEKRTSSSSEHA